VPPTRRPHPIPTACSRGGRALAGALAAGCAGLVGCAAPPPASPPELVIQPAAYPLAFEAARTALRERRYELERIDPAAGVITTKPRSSAGLLAPWTMPHADAAVADTANSQRRTVEVRFQPTSDATAPPAGRPDPLAAATPQPPPDRPGRPIRVTVRVLVDRRLTPTRRLEPSAIALSANTIDPDLARRDLRGSPAIPRRLDNTEAHAIARDLRQRLDLNARRADTPDRPRDQLGPRPDA